MVLLASATSNAEILKESVLINSLEFNISGENNFRIEEHSVTVTDRYGCTWFGTAKYQRQMYRASIQLDMRVCQDEVFHKTAYVVDQDGYAGMETFCEHGEQSKRNCKLLIVPKMKTVTIIPEDDYDGFN
jgi:hypothetical protein